MGCATRLIGRASDRRASDNGRRMSEDEQPDYVRLSGEEMLSTYIVEVGQPLATFVTPA
ncbi:MAG: hypothetical protein QOF79_1797 [Actinomycetota bacterium]|jgi:hypothetical protein|nr:hypothetical protein [Actinomycetota bacterium]